MGLYVFFQSGWTVVTTILQTITVGSTPPDSGAPVWLIVVHALDPTDSTSISNRVRGAYPPDNSAAVVATLSCDKSFEDDRLSVTVEIVLDDVSVEVPGDT